MKKYGLYIIAMVGLLVTISGCAREYEANMRARENMTLYRSKYQQQAVRSVMEAVKLMIRPMEVQWAYNHTERPSCDDSSMPMLSALREILRWHGMAELARARAQAVQYLTPVMQAIYNQHYERFGTPMSTNELLARIGNNLPMLTTVAGMYGLGVSAARYAGDQVTATLESGAMYNAAGNQAGGHYVPGDGNTMSTSTQSISSRGNPTAGGVVEVEMPQPMDFPDDYGE